MTTTLTTEEAIRYIDNEMRDDVYVPHGKLERFFNPEPFNMFLLEAAA